MFPTTFALSSIELMLKCSAFGANRHADLCARIAHQSPALPLQIFAGLFCGTLREKSSSAKDLRWKKEVTRPLTRAWHYVLSHIRQRLLKT